MTDYTKFIAELEEYEGTETVKQELIGVLQDSAVEDAVKMAAIESFLAQENESVAKEDSALAEEIVAPLEQEFKTVKAEFDAEMDGIEKESAKAAIDMAMSE